MKALLRSRTRVVLATLLLWLLLDLARSLHVRLGYDEPTSVWTPDPKVYAEMAWPPAASVSAGAPLGQRVYQANCVTCHGPDGRGNGAGAPSMIPRPRDFTQGLYKYKSTAAGLPPGDADLYGVIADGLHASGMPHWRDLLSEAEIRAVADYVRGLGPDAGAAPASVSVPPRVRPDAASIERGRALYAGTGCAACHGEDLRGGLEQKDAKGYPVVSRDLTAPWTFRGGAAPEQVWLRLTTGLAPAPMPSYARSTSPQERWDLVNFLLANARPAPWEEGGRLAGPGHEDDLLRRGRYLVHAEMCGLCHTEVSPRDVYRGDDRYLAGGMRVGAYPQGIFTSRNLTSDKETGLGDWSEQQIVEAIRIGRAPSGPLNFWGMPWMYLHALEDNDALAIARYLKSLPPVRSEVPRMLRYGVAETLFAKLRGGDFPIARPAVLTYAIGSYANPRGIAADRVQEALGVLQWLVFGGGLLLLPFAAPAGRRLPQGWRGRAGLAGGTLVLLAGLAGGGFVYRMPALKQVPPERVVAGAAGSIPKPDVSTLPRERAALVERGRYLFNVSSCAYCHGNDGAGGAKLSAGFGTLFTPNISSDPQAGLGEWSDAQIARAIRGGISRNGRPLHWQGMPWDHFSNWDEEDIRAIVAYLRLLPPVAEKVPPYRPPAADDCKVYTFWLIPSTEPGCK